VKRWAVCLALGSSLCASVARAHEGPDGRDHAAAVHAASGLAASAPEHDAASEHGQGEQAHGAEAHGHAPHVSDINWFTGMIGESADAEPGLLWRAPGTPVPLGALLINTAILFFLLGRLGGPAVKKGLVERKQRIAGEIEAARVMKADAEEQLAHYETQLGQMESEMERIKAEMREQSQLERERILAEAKARREVVEREAHLAITQESNAAREAISQSVAREAISAARALIARSLNEQDHERLAKDLLASVEKNVKSEARS